MSRPSAGAGVFWLKDAKMQAGEAGEVYPLPRPPPVPLLTNILLILFRVRVYMIPQVLAWRACVVAPVELDLEAALERLS